MVPLSTSGSAAPANVVRKWNLVMSYLDSFHIHEIPFLFRNSEHKKDSIESYETQRNVLKKKYGYVVHSWAQFIYKAWAFRISSSMQSHDTPTSKEKDERKINHPTSL